MSWLAKINNFLAELNPYWLYKRLKYKKEHKVILARDCIAGMLYDQYGIKFNSPTINLFINPLEFCYFINDLDIYLKAELIEEKLLSEKFGWPVGVLQPNNCKPVYINFNHYKTFKEAKIKWEIRCKRIELTKDTIYIVINLTNDVDFNPHDKINLNKLKQELIKIKYKKVILVSESLGLPNEFIIRKHKNWPSRYVIYQRFLSKKRRFNKFDFEYFLNLGSY